MYEEWQLSIRRTPREKIEYLLEKAEACERMGRMKSESAMHDFERAAELRNQAKKIMHEAMKED